MRSPTIEEVQARTVARNKRRWRPRQGTSVRSVGRPILDPLNRPGAELPAWADPNNNWKRKAPDDEQD